VVQNETVAVFEYAYTQPQFDRHTSLAFADPFGVWLKDGKYFF
jgi:hypothetical protein